MPATSSCNHNTASLQNSVHAEKSNYADSEMYTSTTRLSKQETIKGHKGCRRAKGWATTESGSLTFSLSALIIEICIPEANNHLNKIFIFSQILVKKPSFSVSVFIVSHILAPAIWIVVGLAPLEPILRIRKSCHILCLNAVQLCHIIFSLMTYTICQHHDTKAYNLFDKSVISFML